MMKNLIPTLLVLLTLLVVPVKAVEVNDTDIVSVDVVVANKTMVDVNPAAIRWEGVEPGAVGGPELETLGPGFYAIQIENIGSHNITHIWFNNTYPSSRPFATGSSTSYDAGNFIALRREGASTDFFFPNRVEYNESRSLVYLKDPEGDMPPNDWYYGRFRNTSYEYFWMVKPGDGTYCNSSGTTFYIGNTPHTESQTGSTDFSQSAERTAVTLAQSGEWSYGDIPAGHALENYEVAVYYTCDKVIFYKWNMDMPGATSSSNAEYFWSADSGDWPGYPLVPGNSTVAEIRAYVPYGVYEGLVKQGTLTVLVNDQ